MFRTAFRAAIRRLMNPSGTDGPAGQRARAPGVRVRSTATQAVGVGPPRRAEAPRTPRQRIQSSPGLPDRPARQPVLFTGLSAAAGGMEDFIFWVEK